MQQFALSLAVILQAMVRVSQAVFAFFKYKRNIISASEKTENGDLPKSAGVDG